MRSPELSADVWQFDPGVYQNSVEVAGLDERFQIAVALGIGVVVMTGGDLKSGNPGCAPAGCEVVEIHAHAVRVIEERPKAGRTERGSCAEIVECLQDVWEPLVTALAGTGSHPQNGATAAGEAGDERRAGPTLFRKNTRGLWNFEEWQFDRFPPDDGQLGPVHVFNAADDHVILAGTKSEKLGGR